MHVIIYTFSDKKSFLLEQLDVPYFQLYLDTDGIDGEDRRDRQEDLSFFSILTASVLF
jgi:hypothetical protein